MSDTIRRVAILVAMPSELQHLPNLPEMPAGDAPWPSTTWRHGLLDVTAVLTGIGMVRAAAATEATIRDHAPDAILNFGCAGAHRVDVHVGDVVIGTGTVPHGMLIIGPDGTPRHDRFDGAEPPPAGESATPTDPSLLAIARAAAAGWTPEPWPGSDRVPATHEGTVASADIWTQAPDWIDAAAMRHGSLCEDMEAAAIAMVSAAHGVPFLTIKDISNNELHRATVFEPELANLHPDEVGRRAAALIGRMVAALARAAD